MSLESKVAIITGGATGIGFGIAEVLASKGFKLVLAQPQLSVAQEAAKRLCATEVLPVEVDIRNPDRVKHMVDAAVERFGQVNVLVNNAGITGPPALAPFLSCSPAKVDEIVDVNLKGTFYCSQSVAVQMVRQGRGGSIVHIASVGAYAAQEFASLYCATKSALVAFAQAMALELAPQRIRVNCVAPGDIRTGASHAIVEARPESGASSRWVRQTPLGFQGAPRDIGNAVAYLVSGEASFVTGTTLIVDGGFLAY
jgi:NAD(P)-dependent dehydrogenase (short-subunit alcohol dehydrogenase family)